MSSQRPGDVISTHLERSPDTLVTWNDSYFLRDLQWLDPFKYDLLVLEQTLRMFCGLAGICKIDHQRMYWNLDWHKKAACKDLERHWPGIQMQDLERCSELCRHVFSVFAELQSQWNLGSQVFRGVQHFNYVVPLSVLLLCFKIVEVVVICIILAPWHACALRVFSISQSVMEKYWHPCPKWMENMAMQSMKMLEVSAPRD